MSANYPFAFHQYKGFSPFLHLSVWHLFTRGKESIADENFTPNH